MCVEHLQLDDHVFTIKLTPNRADCLSVLGVAREVAALTGAPLKLPASPRSSRRSTRLSRSRSRIRAAAADLPGASSAASNAKAPTPEWMRERLERAGSAPSRALVDVTNYVMLELGSPLHVYDLDKLAGGIDVRFGRKGEKLKLLNEQIVELKPDVLAITDASGRSGWPASWAATAPKRISTRATSFWKRVLLSGCDRRARAPLQLHQRRVASLRARRGLRQQRRGHRARHAADPGNLRR